MRMVGKCSNHKGEGEFGNKSSKVISKNVYSIPTWWPTVQDKIANVFEECRDLVEPKFEVAFNDSIRPCNGGN